MRPEGLTFNKISVLGAPPLKSAQTLPIIYQIQKKGVPLSRQLSSTTWVLTGVAQQLSWVFIPWEGLALRILDILDGGATLKIAASSTTITISR